MRSGKEKINKKREQKEKQPAFRCPACGKEVPRLNFCRECGADIKNWSSDVPKREKQNADTKCFCPYCGAENKKTEICDNCGRHMEKPGAARKCPYCSETTLNHNKCDKCGADIKGITSETCQHCGKESINPRLCDKCGKHIYHYKFLYVPVMLSGMCLIFYGLADDPPVLTSTILTDILYLLISIPIYLAIPSAAILMNTALVKKYGDKKIFAVLPAIAGVIIALVLAAVLLLIFDVLSQLLSVALDAVWDFIRDLFYSIF